MTRSVSRMQKNVSMDSDEEDMRRLLGESFKSPDELKGMRQTETNPKLADKAYRKSSKEVVEKQPVRSAFAAQRRKSLSPSPPSSPKISSPSRTLSNRSDLISSLHSAPDHSEIRSLEELFPLADNHDDTHSETSVLSDDFKINVMTLDDLAPDTLDLAGSSKEKVQSDASPRGLVASSAGELFHKPENKSTYESDFESEIQTEAAQSINDVSEHLSGGYEHSFVASESRSQSDDDDDETLSKNTQVCKDLSQ
ncbi:uncharacterized protein LOC124390843 [Silurus meridionalis]|uniref:uncharacterized protein LOC124390843 n=1 Tax=Silurus meridionalis TaxID=175797 RepID=UPI001EEAB18A|nr:uncharacterized protein LOC124390843 [Silurus meridionalis]